MESSMKLHGKKLHLPLILLSGDQILGCRKIQAVKRKCIYYTTTLLCMLVVIVMSHLSIVFKIFEWYEWRRSFMECCVG